jgi:M6 family metalloprotease-like protein
MDSSISDDRAFPFSSWLARWCRSAAAWRWAGLVVVLWLGALAGTATAAPFDRTFAYTQPDGTAIELWGRGDEFHAVFETLDGYTVVFDPAARAYFYAELSDDRRELRSTGVRVGQAGGAPHGETHLRIDPAAARAQARARQQIWDEQTKVSQRWAALKAQGRARLAAAKSGVALAPPQQPTTGIRTGLCLLVDFPDDEATIPQATVDAMLNGETFTEFGNVRSVKRYYEEVSDGHLMFSNIVTAYIRVPHPKSYYNDETQDTGLQGRLLMVDALAALKARPDYESTILPALAALDVDDQGGVLATSLLFAGAGSSVWAYGLWGQASALDVPVALGNGMQVSSYQLSELGSSPGIGTFCHEVGHMVCGFPDLYDYGYESMGAGDWCLMGFGTFSTRPVEVSAYLKYKAGWTSSLTVLTHDSTGTATVRAGENAFYLYPKNGDPAATEYFIVENRQHSGVDAWLPGSGVCLWHVDEAGSNDNELGTLDAHYECSLMQADGRRSIEGNVNYGDEGDPYYAGNPTSGYTNSFSDADTPSARWWDGTASGAHFNEFSASGATMTFRIGPADSSAPALLFAEPASASAIDLSWAKNAGGDAVLLAWSADGVFGMPAGAYAAGDPITGGGTVLHVGTADGISHKRLEAGTRYHYKLWSSLAGGGYSAGITRAASTRPANDRFADRTEVPSALPLVLEGSNVVATSELGEPAHGKAGPFASVWWSWTAPADCLVEASADGSSFDALVAVYTGESPGRLEVKARNENYTNWPKNSSRVQMWAEAGRTYQIAVDGYSGQTGRVQLSLAALEAPRIAAAPAGQTVPVGGEARFSIEASGGLPLFFGWQVSADGGATWALVTDGPLYAGADTDTLSVLAPTPAMGGYLYRCAIADGVSPELVSTAATLTVRWSRLAALSARARVGGGEQTLILGFAYAGGGKPTLVRGVGPGLADSVAAPLGDPRLRLYASDGTEVAGNDDWAGMSALAGAFVRTGASPLSGSSKDAAVLETLTGTLYTAHVSGAAGTEGVALAEAYDAALEDRTRRLAALSVRSEVGAGESALIAGFVLAGDAPRKVIVRGVGPGLAGVVATALPDPRLQVWKLDPATGAWSQAGANDDWDGTPETAAVFESAGMGPLTAGSKDAALVLTLEPGIYTAQVEGAAGTTGVALVEIYEAP